MKSPALSGAFPKGWLRAGHVQNHLQWMGWRSKAVRADQEGSLPCTAFPAGPDDAWALPETPTSRERCLGRRHSSQRAFSWVPCQGNGAAGLAGKGCVLTSPWGHLPSDLSSRQ